MACATRGAASASATAAAATRAVNRSSGCGAPSAASGLPPANRSKNAAPPDPTMTAARAPASSPSTVSDETGAQAASNAGAASGMTTFSPHAPRVRSSAARIDAPSFVAVVGTYFNWNGYGVENPSEAGNVADLTAASTQVPVGVPANLPVTVADDTLPLLAMTTLTIAVPGTLNWL